MSMNIPQTREDLSKLTLTELTDLIEGIKTDEETAIKTLSDWKKFYFDGVTKKTDLTEVEKRSSTLIVQELNKLNKEKKKNSLKEKYNRFIAEGDEELVLEKLIVKAKSLKETLSLQEGLVDKLIVQAKKIGSEAIITLPESFVNDVKEIEEAIELLTPKEKKENVDKKEAIANIKNMDLDDDVWNVIKSLSKDDLAKLVKKTKK